jgi:hypothetical protein
MLDELVERLETTPAGPFLARLVASVDRAALDGSGALALAEARARLIAHEQAQFLADLAEVGLVDWHTPPGVAARMAAPDEFSVDRIAWTLHWSREAAHTLPTPPPAQTPQEPAPTPPQRRQLPMEGTQR